MMKSSRRESRLARNLSGDGNLPVMKASAESLGWRGKCQATGNLHVMKGPAESLGWQGIFPATGNLPVMKASDESLEYDEAHLTKCT